MEVLCLFRWIWLCLLNFSHTHTHTHTRTRTHTHTHTHTHVGFCGLWGLSIGVMVFILNKLYVLLPYTYPTPKLSPHRRLCASLDFQKKTPFSMFFKPFELRGHRQCPHKPPSYCNTSVIPMSLYKFVPHKPHTHTHTHTHTTHTHTHTHTPHTPTHTLFPSVTSMLWLAHIVSLTIWNVSWTNNSMELNSRPACLEREIQTHSYSQDSHGKGSFFSRNIATFMSLSDK